MRALIGNQVKTEFSDHVFKTREEAEAFYFATRDRLARQQEEPERDVRETRAPSAQRGKRR